MITLGVKTNKKLGLLFQSLNHFAGKNRKSTPKDLDKYELVVVGANLGGIFSKHFDHVTHGKHTTMVCLDNAVNQQFVMRSIYEQGRVPKTQYAPFAKMSISVYNANSEAIGVDKFNPQQNQITLRNGRKIKYDYLVLAMGQRENYESIKGFEEAWADPDHPFFVAKDYHTWKTSVNKPFRAQYNFKGGQAIFYIPPYPFHGEVECYNFFLSKQLWNYYNQDGRLSWDNSKFTVINANDKFVKNFSVGDDYIKTQLSKRNIDVEYGLKLIEVNKNTKIATFVDASGNKVERNYAQVYSLIPAKGHDNLIEAGLASKQSYGFLEVDPQTLQHKKYKNIFGIGDSNDLPVTRTFFGGFSQIHVVRNNLERLIKGLPLNAQYDGFSEAPLILAQDKLTWIQHYYGDKPGSLNLLGGKDPIFSRILYHRFSKMTKKSFINFYLFKTWGPPYGKIKKTFSELPGQRSSSTNSSTKTLQPQKKTA